MRRLVKVIGAFVEVAVAQCRPKKPGPLRLALPLIGTGDGGLAHVTGDVIQPLIDELNNYARQLSVDFVLCVDSEVKWSAVRSARRNDEWGLTRMSLIWPTN